MARVPGCPRQGSAVAGCGDPPCSLVSPILGSKVSASLSPRAAGVAVQLPRPVLMRARRGAFGEVPSLQRQPPRPLVTHCSERPQKAPVSLSPQGGTAGVREPLLHPRVGSGLAHQTPCRSRRPSAGEPDFPRRWAQADFRGTLHPLAFLLASGHSLTGHRPLGSSTAVCWAPAMCQAARVPGRSANSGTLSPEAVAHGSLWLQ